jgi:hypothetical protein
VPQELIDTLAGAFLNSTSYRFLWALPSSQQKLLPKQLVAASNLRHDLLKQATERDTAQASMSEAIEEVSLSADGTTSAGAGGIPASSLDALAGAGSVLLVDWAPQVSILVHNATAVFFTHGGMNSMAEATYSRTPILCMGFFSDQPDNCMHAQDHGMGIAVAWQEAVKHPEALSASLHRLATEPAWKRSMQAAWAENVAAGGLARAVSVVEAAAYQPYGAHLRLIPYEDRGHDTFGAALWSLTLPLWLALAVVTLIMAPFSACAIACAGCMPCGEALVRFATRLFFMLVTAALVTSLDLGFTYSTTLIVAMHLARGHLAQMLIDGVSACCRCGGTGAGGARAA